MKKLISSLLVIVMTFSVFALAGCNSKETADEEKALTVCVVVSSAFGDKVFQ